LIYQRFNEWAGRSPDQEAIVTGAERVTYRELMACADRTSAVLSRAGIRLGDPVAVFLPNGIGFTAGIFGVLRCGGLAVPLNVNYQADELAHYLKHSGTRWVITDSVRVARLKPALDRLDSVPRLIQFESIVVSSDPAPAPAAVRPETPATLQYSTGSTGQPKPVVRTHGQQMAEAHHFVSAVKVTPRDRILAVVPLFHAHGFGNCLLASLMNGATMVTRESFAPREVLSLLQTERITIFPGVPFMFKLLTEVKMVSAPNLSSLRLVFSAGAALDSDVAKGFYKRFGVPVRQLYGSTETGSASINLGADIQDTFESVGCAMPPAEVAVFNDDGIPVASGETGEVGIRSPAMASGYEGLPEITKASFRNGYFFPGDVGRLDAEGRLTITGRKTFFINVGGNKVDPAEVERVIAAYPKVKDVVAVGVKTPYGGEIVKAVVVADGHCEPSEILTACQGRLAEYKLPKLVEFRDEIPRSPLGKVLRKYLV
jgi:long-chain acyl-CoA synthetase